MLSRIRHHRRQFAAPLLAVFALVWTVAVVAPCMAAAPCHTMDQSESPTKPCPDCPTLTAIDCQISYQQAIRDTSRPPEPALPPSATVVYLAPPIEAADATRPWPPRLASAAVLRPQPASPHFVLRL